MYLEQHRGSSASSDFEEEKEELEWLLHHPEISRSASLVRFLSFICNKYFEGEAKDIREYTIAVEALRRKESSFDSHADPIVRVTARALRKRLCEIYKSDGQSHSLHIVVPLGHYVPQFVRQQVPRAEPDLPATDSGREEMQTSARAVFIRANRRAIWKTVSILLAVSGVFFAGFFFGHHSHQHHQSTGESFRWGDPIWSDDFDGRAQQIPDASKWTYDTGTQSGWGNHELELYCSPRGGNPQDCDPRHPNAFQNGAGDLVLRAARNAVGGWTSARITTRGLKNFQYGRIEARMKLPIGSGLWPSFWMLGANFSTAGWPASGSVDIVENVSVGPRNNGLGPGMIRSTLHGPRYFGGNGLWHDFKFPNGASIDGSFHIYGIIWSPGMIQFYVDDPANIFFIEDASDLPQGGEWVFDRPFYLVMNLAAGGDWPGKPDGTTPNPADLLVDYVRVYKIPSVSAPTIQWLPVQVKAGSSVASIVTLQARRYSGNVHLACSTEPATAVCALATSVVNFSDTLAQSDTLTIATASFTDKGRMVSPPGGYKVTITATTISGDHSQLTVPFEVRNVE